MQAAGEESQSCSYIKMNPVNYIRNPPGKMCTWCTGQQLSDWVIGFLHRRKLMLGPVNLGKSQ